MYIFDIFCIYTYTCRSLYTIGKTPVKTSGKSLKRLPKDFRNRGDTAAGAARHDLQCGAAGHAQLGQAVGDCELLLNP